MVCSGRYGQRLQNGDLEVGEVVWGSRELDANVLGEKWGRRSLHHQLVVHSTLDKTFLRPRVRGVRYMKPGLGPPEHRRESVLLDFRAAVRFISPQQHSGDQCLIGLNGTPQGIIRKLEIPLND